MLKILFLGTPSISVNALKSLHENKEIEVVGVVTNEDQLFGRSRSKPRPSAVKIYAVENGLHLIQSDKINLDIDKLKELEYDYLVTCAFGQFLSNEVLSTPKKKAINIHASLLPRGRGGAPIHWAIIEGDKETGISYMDMVSEMDAGNYYQQYKVEITNDETFDSLYKKMQNIIEKTAASSLIEIDDGFESTAQDEVLITKWLNIKKEERIINFNSPADKVYDQIRGLFSIPGATTYFEGQLIKVNASRVPVNLMVQGRVYAPGEVVRVTEDSVIVATNPGYIELTNITMPGKNASEISQLVKGNLIIKAGYVFKNE